MSGENHQQGSVNPNATSISNESPLRPTVKKYSTDELVSAIESNQNDLIREILESGVNPNIPGSSEESPLHLAVEKNKMDAVESLVKFGADVNMMWRGKTPLHIALEKDHLELFDYLLFVKADPDAKSSSEIPPLHLAVAKNNMDAVESLVKFGADVNKVWRGWTPLQVALEKNYKVIFKFFVKSGSDVRLLTNKRGDSPLIKAIDLGNNFAIDKILECGMDPNVLSRSGKSPLHLAVWKNNMAAVESLVKFGADVNTMWNGRTPLQVAFKLDNMEIFDYVLSSKADPDAKSSSEIPPLHLTVAKNNMDAVESLVKFGADVNKVWRGWTPLQVALHNNHDEIDKYLLSKKADVNKALHLAVTKNKRSVVESLVKYGAEMFPLHMAIEKNSKSAVESLVKFGVDVNKLWCGKTPLEIALEIDHLELFHYLLSVKADPNATSSSEKPLIHLAVETNNREAVESLVEYGADVNNVWRWKTPLLFALEYSYEEIGNYLLSRGADVNIALHLAVAKNNNAAVESLVKFGSDINNVWRGKTPLLVALEHKFEKLYIHMQSQGGDINMAFHLAVEANNMEAVKTLVKFGVDVNKLWRGKTPLQLPLEKKYKDMFECLVTSKADVKLVTDNQQEDSPLIIALESDHNFAVDKILESGVDPNVPSRSGKSPLHLAVEKNNMDAVESLVKFGADVNKVWRAQTPLQIALEKNYKNIFACLVKSRAEMKQITDNQQGDSPLIIALESDHNFAVDKILESGVDPNVPSRSGKSPLHLAVEKNSSSAIDSLLKYGADINKMWKDQTPLQIALKMSLRDTFAKLVIKGANLTHLVKSPSDVSALIIAIHNNALFAVEKILELNIDPNAEADGQQPLTEAIKHQNLPIILCLLYAGADPDSCQSVTSPSTDIKFILQYFNQKNKVDRNGDTILHKAVASNNWHEALNCIQMGCDINLKNKSGKTAIDISSEMGLREMTFMLHVTNVACRNKLFNNLKSAHEKFNLEDVFHKMNKANAIFAARLAVQVLCSSIDPTFISRAYYSGIDNMTNIIGHRLFEILDGGPGIHTTPLHMERITPSLADVLLRTKNVDPRDEFGRTPLLTACSSDNIEYFRKLIQTGADPSVCDHYGRSIMHLWNPKLQGFNGLHIKDVLCYNISINAQDYNGHTALHLAVYRKKRHMIRELLAARADFKVPDKNGITPWHLATCDSDIFNIVLNITNPEIINLDDVRIAYYHNTLDAILERTECSQSKEKALREELKGRPQQGEHIDDDLSTNPTFTLSKQLKTWVRLNLKDMKNIANVFDNTYKPNLLCAAPASWQVEMKDTVTNVLDLMRDVADQVKEMDPSMEFEVVLSGSSREGTKVIEPNEVDLLLSFKCFKGLQVAGAVDFKLQYFVVTASKDSEAYKKHRYMFDNQCHLSMHAMLQRAYYLIIKALQSKSLWKKHPKLSRIDTYNFSCSDRNIRQLDLLWHGFFYPWLEISVDLVACFPFPQVPGGLCIDHPLVKKNGCYIVAKWTSELVDKTLAHKAFRICLSDSACDLFHLMPTALRQGYMQAKVILSKLPVIDGIEAKHYFCSYHIKMCTFHIFTEHLEYHDIINNHISPVKSTPHDFQPLENPEEIMMFTRQIFNKLEDAVREKNLIAFFEPDLNLFEDGMYSDFRALVYVRICKALVSDPQVHSDVWEDLIDYKIEKGNIIQVDDEVDNWIEIWDVYEDPDNTEHVQYDDREEENGYYNQSISVNVGRGVAGEIEPELHDWTEDMADVYEDTQPDYYDHPQSNSPLPQHEQITLDVSPSLKQVVVHENPGVFKEPCMVKKDSNNDSEMFHESSLRSHDQTPGESKDHTSHIFLKGNDIRQSTSGINEDIQVAMRASRRELIESNIVYEDNDDEPLEEAVRLPEPPDVPYEGKGKSVQGKKGVKGKGKSSK